MTEPQPLLGPTRIRELAAAIDLRPTKSWGQNFVVDSGTVRKIVRAAGVEQGNHVVEIGPGLGSLTLGLLETGATVTAVEIDPKLAALLPNTVAEHQPDAAGRLTVINQDALTITQLPDPQPTALVANLPYNVSVPVLLTFLERFPSLERVLVMVQAEVADRLAAGPGSRTYGVPSAKAAWYTETRHTHNWARSLLAGATHRLSIGGINPPTRARNYRRTQASFFRGRRRICAAAQSPARSPSRHLRRIPSLRTCVTNRRNRSAHPRRTTDNPAVRSDC